MRLSLQTDAMPRADGSDGNAMLEFALGASVLVSLLAGTFQFGYTFYVYDQLQSAVRNGVRYGSMRAYKSQEGSCVERVKTSVRNMVVYGTPNPADGAPPLVRGLTRDKVTVTYTTDAEGVPSDVTVVINNFTVDAIFAKFTFNGKPFATVPYVGRYAPNECDP